MSRANKVWFSLAGVILVLAVIGSVSPPAPEPQRVAEPGEHDCSGAMKEAMANDPNLERFRQSLCAEGGEAKIDAMIKERMDERRRPAF